MGIGYQKIDRKAFDYHLWALPKVSSLLRGPRSWSRVRRYLCFLGAAQTFGRFAQTPYPEIVARWLRTDHLNFGFAGAGPEFFVGQPALLDYVNGADACFLQVMSGRSVSTSLLKAVGNGGVLEFTSGPLAGRRMLALSAYEELMRHYDEDSVVRQVSEARKQWTAMYQELIARIRVPVILVWMSTRKPQRGFDGSSARNLLGEFPQLIDENCILGVRERVAGYVEVVYPEERPQLLLNLTTRRPEPVFSEAEFPNRPDWTRCYNNYYPSPRMHEFTALRIVEAMSSCPDLLARIRP